ncbi:transglycosylase SLT domain-containing protein [Limnoraphis robusta Tam1]|uniref:lytic transglycosylase domain-containing protein n=1 Tax=Limnoraphis robusta TaxID=1118279 RepID=UPI002B1EC4C3|nr:transglycosylase SLT domain-containing protein [Limnoraphis robusta]MEA5541738.1 transglycosylase SLT domain-containing protein [Limnoraphis robusta Tam1]
MVKQRITQFALLLGAASVALAIGIFFPITQLQRFLPSREVSVQESNDSERVIMLASLSAEKRQVELKDIAASSKPSTERSRARFLLASDLIQQKQAEEAIPLLAGLEQDYPLLGAQIVMKRAQAYEQMGDTAQAKQAWEDLLQRFPEDPTAAEALYVLGKENPEYWDRAIAEFPAHPRSVEIAQTRLKENPNQLPLLLIIAEHGIYLKDYGTYLEKLAQNYTGQLKPEDWEKIAFGYWEKQDYGKGALAYAKAPRTPRNLYRHARGLWLDDKIPESRKAYEQLIQAFPEQQDPGGEDAGFGLIRLARLSDRLDAVKYLDQAIARFPAHRAEALYDKAELLDQLESKQSASQARQMLLKDHSESEPAAQLRWKLAEDYAKAGNIKEASKWAKELSTKNPDSELAPEATFWIGKWAQQIGNSQDTKKAFEYLLARYPDSYYAWRSAVHLGWPVGDFTTVRPLNPHVEYPETHPVLMAGSDGLKELYQLGKHQEAWKLWQVEFANRMQPSIEEQYTDGLVRLGVGDNLEALWMLSSLSQRDEPEERQKYLKLKKTPEYWQALYPFPYLETIVNWSQERQLNTVLVTALIRQESRFMPGIKSVVGATGLMQVMPETGEEVAKQIQLTNYSLENIEDNVNLGTYYLDFTHREYNNNSLLAVASYNAGPNAVSGWLERFGFQDADAFAEKIPYPETYGYVKSVFGNYWNYLRIYNPDIAAMMEKHAADYKPN